MTSNQASDSTKQLKEQQYTEEHYRAIQKHTPRLRNNTPPICTNRRSYELIIRRQASDTGKTFFECEICGRVTTDYFNLNKDCRLHTGEKPFKRNECEKAFSDRSDYDVHCRTHGEKTNRTTSNLKSPSFLPTHLRNKQTHSTPYITYVFSFRTVTFHERIVYI